MAATAVGLFSLLCGGLLSIYGWLCEKSGEHQSSDGQSRWAQG